MSEWKEIRKLDLRSGNSPSGAVVRWERQSPLRDLKWIDLGIAATAAIGSGLFAGTTVPIVAQFAGYNLPHIAIGMSAASIHWFLLQAKMMSSLAQIEKAESPDAPKSASVGDALMYLFEQLTNRDINNDGVIGQPAMRPVIKSASKEIEKLGQLDTVTTLNQLAINTGHILISGETGSGKSTLVKSLMTKRTDHRVVVLDNHLKYGEWSGYRTYSDVETICTVIRNSWKMMEKRKEQARMQEVTFEPITLIIDEVPVIVDYDKDALHYMSKLIREGRKYGIFVCLIAQDTQVKTLGIEGQSQLLKNFKYQFKLGTLADKRLTDGVKYPVSVHTLDGIKRFVYEPSNTNINTDIPLDTSKESSQDIKTVSIPKRDEKSANLSRYRANMNSRERTIYQALMNSSGEISNNKIYEKTGGNRNEMMSIIKQIREVYEG